MQLPEVLTQRNVLEVLNTLGVGLLGIGLIVIYRALIVRSKLLSKSLIEIKVAYDTVVLLMKRRSEDVDLRFEDEKKFRKLYLTLVEDAETHKAKIKAWKDDELSILQSKITEMSERLRQLEKELEELTAINQYLKKLAGNETRDFEGREEFLGRSGRL
jgi:hypothetical protein